MRTQLTTRVVFSRSSRTACQSTAEAMLTVIRDLTG
jgi:hypothetical protein